MDPPLRAAHEKAHFRALRPLGTSHRRDQHGSSERLQRGFHHRLRGVGPLDRSPWVTARTASRKSGIGAGQAGKNVFKSVRWCSLPRTRCPRSQGKRRAERVSLGARATRPHVGRRPTGVFKRARGPRSQGKRRAERVSLGARATRPHVGRRPTGVSKRARCPRSQGRHRAERVSLGARAARPHVGRRPTGVFMRARCPRSQGKRRAERVSLGARATRPHVGRRPTRVFMRARCPRSREHLAPVAAWPQR